jgi:cell cycle checkpoint protein
LNSIDTFHDPFSFNPIAPTLLRKALQHVLHTHFASTAANPQQHLSKDALDVIVETSNGDIRSAITALQFAFIVQPRDKKGKKAIRGGGGMRAIFDAVTRREQSLALFHLLGKVFYNKSK